MTEKSEATDALSYVDNLLLERKNNPTTSKLLKDEEYILQDIRTLHATDYATARASPLALEEEEPLILSSDESSINFEWMENNVAVQSLDPLLPENDLQLIRGAAEAIWQQQSKNSNSESTSRFTYQYEGNSEAHVSDFVEKVGEDALVAVNQCLTRKIYPWLRQVFFSDESQSTPSQLFVYDALVIRYNATASATATAGQPLHRDLGIVSVNVMLNEGFEGGGTFFENQHSTHPLKPRNGPGHALAHYSHERHAGAGTSKGVRDILVLFISAKDPLPRLVNARLKQGRDRCRHLQDPLHSLLCRVTHQRLAIQTVSEDGEAFQYLGSVLMEYSQYLKEATTDNQQPIGSTEALVQAVRCFQKAQQLTPGDARVYNNWAITLAKLEDQADTDLGPAGQVYQKGFDLLRQAEQAGCLVADDLDSLSLNYGLYLANQDNFCEASAVLEGTASKFGSNDGSQLLGDAHRLWKFCCRQLEP